MLGWFIAVALASGIVGWCAGYTTAADRFDMRPRYGLNRRGELIRREGPVT